MCVRARAAVTPQLLCYTQFQVVIRNSEALLISIHSVCARVFERLKFRENILVLLT